MCLIPTPKNACDSVRLGEPNGFKTQLFAIYYYHRFHMYMYIYIYILH